jgi:uncharacterized protein (DUF697 family)
MSTTADAHVTIAERARGFAPVVWLLGKVQSGKTSIIRELTEATDAEIGSGFRACTKTARVYDFPPEAPIIRFLDTRGLGEVDYDPAADIGFCEGRAHLLLVVMKALDLEQTAVLEIVRAVRRRHSEWPVVVAQTTLHEAYPRGGRHVLPYPFQATPPIGVPEDLMRALAYQRALIEGALGQGEARFVPIDFTHAEDGFEPAAYGRDALLETLIAAAPTAVAVALAELPVSADASKTASWNAHILGFALAAGASDVVPLAGAVAVPVVQAAMLRQLSELNGVSWDRRAYAEFATALGAGTLVRTASAFGLRQLIKLIPVYGQTVGAAAAAATSFATTYAMGKAANYYLARRRQGRQVEDVTTIYQRALREAFELAKARAIGSAGAKS